MNLHPETLHGLHYTEEQFDAELEKRLHEQIQADGAAWDETDRSSYKRHFLKKIYAEWNPGTDSDDFIQFETANSMKYSGFATMGYAKQDDSNPLLTPIHGISLNDYAAIAMNLTNFQEEDLFTAFGIDLAIWQEINTLWPKRMQEDTTFTVATLYSQSFMEAGNHPVIDTLRKEKGSTSEEKNENILQLRTDKYFYIELEAARTAAYQYGIDGAQWIEDNFGISLMDFQAAAMEWMTQQNHNFDSNLIMEDHRFREEKENEYKTKFAAEQGGDLADDIAF